MVEQDFSLPSIPDKLPKLPDTLPTLPDFGKQTQPKEYVPRPTYAPPKVTPKEPEAETLGFIKNLPRSVVNAAKSIFVDFPVMVGNTAYHYAQNPEQYGKDLDLFLSHPGDTGEFLGRQLTDYYTDNFWRNFNDDPARLLMDAAMVLDGVGLAGKAGNAGRAASVAARAADAGHLGLLSEGAQTAAKVGRTLQGVGSAAEYVDPLRVAGKGLKLAFGKGLEAFGYGEHTQDIENIAAHLSAREALETQKVVKDRMFYGLTDPEKEEMRRLVLLGDTDELRQASKRTDNVGKRLREWNDRITTTEEPFWNRDQLMLNDEDMIKANAKGVEVYTNSPEWNGIPIMADQAEQMIRDGTLKPTYMSLYRLKNNSLSLYDVINSPTRLGKTLGRLEQRLGNGEYLTDIDEIMARQTSSFHQAKYKIGLLDSVRQYLSEKGKILVAHSPEEIEAAKGLGYRQLHDEYFRQYWDSYSKAGSAQVQELVNAAKKGLNQQERLKNLTEAFNRMDSVGKLKELSVDRGAIFVPAHVAAWLNRELAPVSAGWHFYDKWMSRFKSMATVFNPRYWIPVAFGNALLGTLYGLSPDMVKLALKYRGDLPPVLKTLVQHDVFLKDLGIFDRRARRFGEAATMLDNIYRQGIAASEIVKGSYARTKFSLATFFPAMDNMEQAVKYFSAAPERYISTLNTIATMRNHSAALLLTRDKEATRLKRLESKLTGEIDRLMREKEISLSELSTSINARKDQLALALSAQDLNTSRLGPLRDELQRLEGILEDYRVNKTPLPQGVTENSLLSEIQLAGEKLLEESSSIKYTYFSQRFNSLMKQVTSAIRKGTLLDNNGIVVAIDSAIEAVKRGKPEWLRYSVKRLQKALGNQSNLMRKRSRLSVFVDMVGASEQKLAERTTELMQKLMSAGTLSRQLPGLARDSAVMDRAIAVGNRFYGSFHDLLPFEKQVVKRIIPFYTFTKAMTKLAFQFPFMYPKRSFLMIHLARTWNDIMQDENAYMPSWSKNYIPVAATEDGGVVLIRVGSIGPMGNVRMNRMGEAPMPGVWDVASQNPVIRMFFEMKGGIPDWSAKPLSPGDQAVRLDNGTVMKWTGTGFQTEIAQPSAMKSIAYLFPQAQLIDTLLHRYAQTDRGWLFNPQPMTDPAGKILYPKTLHDVLMSVFLPTTSVSPHELELREKTAVALVAKEYMKEARVASPDRRADLVESLKAWAQSRKHAIER